VTKVKVGVGSAWGAAAAKVLSQRRVPSKSKLLTCMVESEMQVLGVLDIRAWLLLLDLI